MKSNADQQPGDIDLSVLRTPIPTSVTGFLGVMKAFGDGTEEMRRVLERECDIIYECKVCRNIFRDVANLMTHKRLYCKTAFNSTRDFHFPENGFVNPNISSIVIEQEQRTVIGGSQEWTKRDKVTGELQPKDLGGLVQRMRMKQVMTGTMKPMDYYDLVSSKVTLEDVMEKKHLLHLEKIPQSNVAMYQTVNMDDGDTASTDASSSSSSLRGEPMKREVDEVHKLSSKTDIVVGPDGKALKLAEFRDTVARDEFEVDSIEELLLLCHYEPDGETETPHECAICEARFETEKTLILHIQLKHISSTKVYQCPSCSETFLQASLVIKHLSNDHKKSLKKIRSMREAIHKRHMRIDEVQVKGPSRELHRLQTEKERIEAENKAYLDNVANLDTTNQSMCTYCNKIFERKAVLTSHMVNCRSKFEKSFMASAAGGGSASGNSSSTSQPQQGEGKSAGGSGVGGGAKRGPKPKENGAKEKELIHDENSSSTVISSDGSNEGGVQAAAAATAENGESSSASGAAKRKRKLGAGGKSQSAGGEGRKRAKKEEQQQQPQHSKVSELMEKEICTAADQDRDDSYFSFDDKAPEDARDEPYKRRFPCDICNKDFSTQSNLKRHNVMFHYFQNRYSCSMCSCPAMQKKDALAHLRDVHEVQDKEEHELKALLRQEKNEVSSSEVLDLDLDESSSQQEQSTTTTNATATTTTERDNSRATSPVPNSTAASSSSATPPESMAANNSNSSSSGVSSSPSANGETPTIRRRGRPKGSIKKLKSSGPTERVDRELRTDAEKAKKELGVVVATSQPEDPASECDQEKEKQNVGKVIRKKKRKQQQPIISPAPPQLMDGNSSSSSTTTTTAANTTAASNRPIRNRTKPKDKDFVYDLKGDYIYEDEAMDTALSESILSASSMASSFSATSSTSLLLPAVDKVPGKRRTSSVDHPQHRSSSDTNVNGGEGHKRGVGRPPRVRPPFESSQQSNPQEREGLFKSKSSSKINWEKNVMIPTRIIEHRHSVEQHKGLSAASAAAHLKSAELRRNSVEVMTMKNGLHVKEKEIGRLASGGPLGMIENIMEAQTLGRSVSRDEDQELKEAVSHVVQEGPRRHFGSAAEVGAVDHHHVLLNGRSLGEILSMSSPNGLVLQQGQQQPGAAVVMED